MQTFEDFKKEQFLVPQQDQILLISCPKIATFEELRLAINAKIRNQIYIKL